MRVKGFLITFIVFAAVMRPACPHAEQRVDAATSTLDAAVVNFQEHNEKAKSEKKNRYEAPSVSADEGEATVATPSEDALNRLKVVNEVTPETTELLGERIDLNSGSVSFHQVDVSIPGNFPIEVAVRREFRGGSFGFAGRNEFGDWSLAIPTIHTTLLKLTRNPPYTGSWGQGIACSGPLNPGPGAEGGEVIMPWEFWNGDTINVAGQSEKLLSGNIGAIYPRKTQNNWRLSCVPLLDGVGEGFRGESPDGLVYTFNKLKLVRAPDLVRSLKAVQRYQAFMMATKIEDRFGNWVKYEFSDPQNPNNLTRIIGSDGRQISLTYKSGVNSVSLIDTVTANGRTWRYGYDLGSNTLQTVTRPDNKRWIFDLYELGRRVPSLGDTGSDLSTCTLAGGVRATAIGSITHPNGIKGEFLLAETLHGRTEVPFQSNGDLGSYTAACYSTMAVKRKSLTGPGLTSLTWNYSYSENKGAFIGAAKPQVSGLDWPAEYNAADLRGDLKTTIVNAPDGTKSVHVFNRRWNFLDGKEVLTDYYDSDRVSKLKRVERSYVDSGIIVGRTMIWYENGVPHENVINLSKEVIRNYVNGSVADTYTTEYSDYNSYGIPQLKKESNSFSPAQRWTRTSYLHDTTQWLLNLPSKTELSDNGSVYATVSETVYYPAAIYGCTSCGSNLQPRYLKRFGSVVKEFESYLGDGNVQRVNFGLSNRWQQFADYKRGKAQRITLPSRYASCSVGSNCPQASLEINDDGTVAAVTDFNGNQTRYGYDSLARLTLIDPVDPQWSDTNVSYSDGAGGELVQTISRGNFQKVTRFDALLRPTLVSERDTSIAGSERYTVSRYNAYNKPVFQSFASTSAAETQGSTFEYDGLQRPTAVISTVDGSATRTRYLGGNQIEVTNPRGYVTTTGYLAYGAPDQGQPLVIRSPENVTTTLTYNLFGNVTNINQGGVTESRLYDANQFLCKTIRPETNHTLYRNNALGDVLWSVEGVTGSTTACETSTSATNQASYSYDNRGDLRSIDYADSTPDLLYSKDNQGNLLELKTGALVSGVIAAPSASNTHSQWAYAYNSANQIETETLSLDGLSFTLDPSYNTLGQLSSLKYPSGSQYAFAPNALGQPTTAGSYAIAAQYHPNGSLKSFSYGNGLTYSLTLDAEQRPDVLTAAGATVQFDYGFDANNNLSSLVDRYNGAYSLSGFSYDGLDRLKAVTGNWGAGSFAYDDISNLTSQTLGSTSSTYSYSPSNKLGSITGSQSKSFGYDGRGNLTSLNGITLTFNAANQLVSGNGATYRYDGHNRQIKKTSGSNTTYSLYNQTGTLIARRVNGVWTDYIKLGSQLVAEVTGTTPTVTYQHTDVLGSTIAESNPAGTITARYHYQPFGQRIESYSSDDLGYTGHQHDNTLGLTYAQARYYDQGVGRFLSNDPVSFDTNNVQSFNRYAYGNNNPYKYTDPDGRLAFLLPLIPAAVGALVDATLFVGSAAVVAYKVNGMLNESAQQEPKKDEPKKESEAKGRIKELVGEKPTTEGLRGLKGKGFEWKGNPNAEEGGNKGAYVNDETKEQVHNDLDSHSKDSARGPHVTYTDSDGQRWDYFPDTDKVEGQ